MMNRLNLFVILLAGSLCMLGFSFCESGIQQQQLVNDSPDSLVIQNTGHSFKAENRTEIFKRLSGKISAKKPLYIHVFVPLCDNDHQGIVPVNKQLGDGLNVRTNLYWGAGYGVKSYFKKYGNWKLYSSFYDSSGNVIERVIYSKKNAAGTQLYLIADGYRGDRMKECLHDYFRSLSGWKKTNDTIKNIPFFLYGNADLIIFNGHDGLMDDTLKRYYSKDSVARETVTIACYAKTFFNDRFSECGAYPLIGTSGLLAPEAYVMDAVIENWALRKSALEIKNAAGDAYHAKHPSASQKGARALFTTGW